MNWKVLLAGLVLVIPLVWLLATGFGHDPRALPSMLEGHPAPDFTLQSLDGETITLSAYRGRPVVLNFWATWCSPCVEENAVLQAQARREGQSGVAFIGVLYGDEPDRARAYLKRVGNNYPTVVDPAQHVIVDYGVGGVPETFFISKDGMIVQKENGALNAALLSRSLARLK